MSGRKTRRPGEIAIPPGSGFGKAHRCSCWPRPDDSSPCTPQTCDWRCRACRVYGRPFYSRDDLKYLEHGTGPLAAELARLWRAKVAMKGRPAGEGASEEIDGWALPRGVRGPLGPFNWWGQPRPPGAARRAVGGPLGARP